MPLGIGQIGRLGRIGLSQPHGGGAVLPEGAIGVWYADTLSAASGRSTIPNRASSASLSQNLLSAPRRLFNNSQYWSAVGVTVTDGGFTDPNGGTEASRIVGTGNCYLRATYSPSSTATRTIGVWLKSNTGSSQNCRLGISAASTNIVITTTWQRFTYTASHGASGQAIVAWSDGTNGLDVLIFDAHIFNGSVDLGAADQLGGHLVLGNYAGDTRPSYSAGVLDMSVAGARGLVQLAAGLTTNTFTVSACVKKVGNGSAYQALLSKVEAYTTFSTYLELSGAPQFIFGTQTLAAQAGTPWWDKAQRSGWHVITLRYDGAVASIFLDDLIYSTSSAAASPQTLANLFFCAVAAEALTTGHQLNSLILWDVALNDVGVRQAYAALRERATTNGLSVNAPQILYCAEGDSLSAESSSTWNHQYAANANAGVFGTVRALSGHTLASRTAAAPVTNSLIYDLPHRKFVLSLCIGANDLGSYASGAAFSVPLFALCDTYRAAGWRLALCTNTPNGSGAGFNTKADDLANLIRASVGVHCDAIIDFRADSIMGDPAKTADTNYFRDGLHPTVLGYSIMEGVARPILNALAA